jgi:hypothetical protein
MEKAFEEGQGPHRVVEPVMMMMLKTVIEQGIFTG